MLQQFRSMRSGVDEEITHDVRESLGRKRICLNLVPIECFVDDTGLGIRQVFKILRGGIDPKKFVRTLLKSLHCDALVRFTAGIGWVIHVSAFESQHNGKK